MKRIYKLLSACLIVVLMAIPSLSAFAANIEHETESQNIITRSVTSESVLIDKVYFYSNGENCISSREPIPMPNSDFDNYISGTVEYFDDGLDVEGRPQYTVKATLVSNPLKLKSSTLMTRAEGVSSWHTNKEDHDGYTGINSWSYVYTTPDPPSNPYCQAMLTAVDEENDEYAVWAGTLRNAK